MEKKYIANAAAILGALMLVGAGCEQTASVSTTAMPTLEQPSTQPSEQPSAQPSKPAPQEKAEVKRGRLLVSGTVTHASNGKAVPGALMSLKSEGRVFYADVNGRFTIDLSSIDASEVVLTASAETFEVTAERTEAFEPGKQLTMDFTLKPMDPQPGFTLVFPDAVYAAGDAAVTIHVVDKKTGKGVKDVPVLVLKSSTGGKTGSDGSMQLKNINPQYPATFRLALLDYELTTKFLEAKNEFVVHFVPGFTTDVTLYVTQ